MLSKRPLVFAILFIIIPYSLSHGSSESPCAKGDVVLYNITLKQPEGYSVKDGIGFEGRNDHSLIASGSPSDSSFPPQISGAYSDYYRKVRNRIRDRLISRYYNGLAEGDINLVFILTSSGTLESVNICENVSVKDAALRDITMRCVKESAPFPPFPKTLTAPKMSFDLSVSFRKD